MTDVDSIAAAVQKRVEHWLVFCEIFGENPLYLDNMGLVEIPANIPTNIRALVLRNNKIQKLSHDSLVRFTGLTHIDLARNQLQKFSCILPETLEELAIENRDIFMEHGGENYQYIPALNDRPDHIHALVEIIRDAL